MEYVATRYLYGNDEVEASLITSLLNRKDVRECYFWAYELFYSGFDIERIIWNIYYDFYFEYNPQLEPYIRKKLLKLKKTKCNDSLAFIIRNIFRGKSSSKVFTLRQFIVSHNPKSIVPSLATKYKGRKPRWCQNHHTKYHQWLLSISKCDYVKIAHYTYELSNHCSVDLLFEELVSYFRPFYQITESIQDYWNNRTYKDDAHFLLSIIVNLCDFNTSVSTSTLRISPRGEDLRWIRDVCYDVLVSKNKPYNVLSLARKYRIRTEIGSFVLAREEIKDLRCIYSCWENYAYACPLWQERFNQYGARLNCSETNSNIDNMRSRVTFDDDDDLEAFYDAYGLEPDEQSKHTQEQGIVNIPLVSWVSWHDTLFHEKCLIPFDEDFRFTL